MYQFAWPPADIAIDEVALVAQLSPMSGVILKFTIRASRLFVLRDCWRRRVR
jgi:hypothetical protein